MNNQSLFAAGLDAGSSFTRCVIALYENERIRFLGHGCVRSDGWSKGRIANQQAVSACILEASVDETIHEGVAACYAAALPEDRRDGVALLDIGRSSSELVCYYGESAQLVSSLRICGDHFSRDLAHDLRIPAEEAAVVKEQFGG